MIRVATLADVDRIASIYNEAVLEGKLTGDLEPLSIENRRAWFLDHQERYAVFVAVEADRVVGYAAISPYRNGRQVFSETCEVSYYFARAHRGRGLGATLIDHAIAYAVDSGFRLIVALILECNRRSVDLLVKRGFSISGRLPQAARIDGDRVDHLYLSRLVVPESN
jgi:L-amino acid N-acyltransferase YncA